MHNGGKLVFNGPIEGSMSFYWCSQPPHFTTEDEEFLDRSSMAIYRRRFCNFLHSSIIAERKPKAEEIAREAAAKKASRIADAAEARLRRESLWREYCNHNFLDDRKCAIESLPAGRKRKDDIIGVLKFDSERARQANKYMTRGS